MKLQILTNESYKIEGFKHYFIDTEGEVDLSDIFSNECEEILLGDCVNKVPLAKVEKFLVTIFSKLRKDGNIKMSFLNPRLLAMSLCRDEISLGDYNITIYSNKSLIDLDCLEAIILNNGLTIVTCKINGVGYDLTISR
jgi:hypothetical protein